MHCKEYFFFQKKTSKINDIFYPKYGENFPLFLFFPFMFALKKISYFQPKQPINTKRRRYTHGPLFLSEFVQEKIKS